MSKNYPSGNAPAVGDIVKIARPGDVYAVPRLCIVSGVTNDGNFLNVHELSSGLQVPAEHASDPIASGDVTPTVELQTAMEPLIAAAGGKFVPGKKHSAKRLSDAAAALVTPIVTAAPAAPAPVPAV